MHSGAAEPILGAENVSLVLGDHSILSGVDLAVAPGESVTLVGPNGAGKTMLLRVLMGLVPPTSGVVTRKPGLRVGYLPQTMIADATLPMDVQRFVAIGTSASKARRSKALEDVGLGALSRRPIHDLSGGEMRRAMLARALLRDPDILVLDEPVQGVDLPGQVELYDRIAKAKSDRGCAVLMVSHDLNLVMAATDRVICLNHHICCEGAPDSVRDHAEYRALFGDEVDGLAVYTHHHDHAHGADGEVVPIDQAAHETAAHD
ncbi:MAG: metal ABC transporter ATP-binding protein [Alphaproteobacteria bacterium]|jgi:zinc transport system ATP-binding protein|nr:metal ABC transporter ATP-binding protein [Alphaproteobacteria bacterium]MBT4711401.1 metal ABC transporter ATP-binding protein [Alphaproteobacteria bacterium]MBT5861241.1 metal ABC transporter ATP-binding protein [Alphaproteobacteria bacterium]